MSLTAPVSEGVDDPTLDAGVGHLPASSWPAQGGTTVLEAHDVTFFSHIDQLRRGDTLIFSQPCQSWTYAVDGATVLKQGQPLPTAIGTRIVLVTCWPINALFFTTHRYVVSAELTRTEGVPTAVTEPAKPIDPSWNPVLPGGLSAPDLTLQKVSMPMGTMHFGASVEPAWIQSPQPLRLEKNAIIELNAGLAALGRDRTDWWAVVAPNITMPTSKAIVGHPLPYVSPVDVTENVTAGHASSVTFDTALRDVSGGVHRLHATIAGSDSLHITSWLLQ